MGDKTHATVTIFPLDADLDLGPKPAPPRSFLHRLRLPSLLVLLATLFVLSLTALLYLTIPSTTLSLSFKTLTPTHLFCPLLHDTTFNEHPIYKSLSPASDAAWEALVPENGGFILQKEVGVSGEGKMGISMFHQLHCLVMLRGWVRELKGAANATFAAENGGSAMRMDMGMDGQSTDDAPDFREVHLLHCFDYLRQGITCAADSTLEPTTTEMHAGKALVDGDGVVHTCGDSERLWERMGGGM